MLLYESPRLPHSSTIIEGSGRSILLIKAFISVVELSPGIDLSRVSEGIVSGGHLDKLPEIVGIDAH